ncbi:membrane protein [Paenibacillus macerans]|uniref:ABC-2 transporter family protein n=2 Tax=Paenibacillus macerans TaxID=44252 RepID=A0A090Z319_PAEMA|nr:ABC-2 transporter family protein [Paenibacillus macerans]GBK67303.1 multidrug ABC transporter permease [Paenibacillus macerans]SUA85278.1 membrane protein [Paenibacillus macerans]
MNERKGPGAENGQKPGRGRKPKNGRKSKSGQKPMSGIDGTHEMYDDISGSGGRFSKVTAGPARSAGAKPMSWLNLYRLLIRTSIKSRMQYKFNFVLGTVLAALIQISEFLMIAIVLDKFGVIQGWSVYEIGYLFAVMTLSRTLYRTFAEEVHHLEKYLVGGELDQLLTRPMPVLLALMPQNFRLMPGELLQGGFILCWSLGAMTHSGQVGWIAVPFTLFIIVTGAVILFSIGLATATLGFWTTRISELQNFTEDAAQTAARYPLTLYPKWMSSLFLFVIPVGFVNYVPSLYILRGEWGPWILAATAGAAAVCLAASLRFWLFGITKYQSTGS